MKKYISLYSKNLVEGFYWNHICWKLEINVKIYNEKRKKRQ